MDRNLTSLSIEIILGQMPVEKVLELRERSRHLRDIIERSAPQNFLKLQTENFTIEIRNDMIARHANQADRNGKFVKLEGIYQTRWIAPSSFYVTNSTEEILRKSVLLPSISKEFCRNIRSIEFESDIDEPQGYFDCMSRILAISPKLESLCLHFKHLNDSQLHQLFDSLDLEKLQKLQLSISSTTELTREFVSKFLKTGNQHTKGLFIKSTRSEELASSIRDAITAFFEDYPIPPSEVRGKRLMLIDYMSIDVIDSIAVILQRIHPNVFEFSQNGARVFHISRPNYDVQCVVTSPIDRLLDVPVEIIQIRNH